MGYDRILSSCTTVCLGAPLKPEWQLFWIVKHGVRYTGMGAWENLMSDDKIWSVVVALYQLRVDFKAL